MKNFTFDLLKSFVVYTLIFFVIEWFMEAGFKLFKGLSFAEANEGFKFNFAIWIPIAVVFTLLKNKRQSK